MGRLEQMLAEAAGFPRCPSCMYLESGTSGLCLACAERSFRPLADSKCMVCDQSLEAGRTRCGNWLCNDDDRHFEWNFAVAMLGGNLEAMIRGYKYGDDDAAREWAQIIARILVGFLERNRLEFDRFDLIVASPSYVDPQGGGRTFDHTREVLRRAAEESWPPGCWPFDLEEPAAIVKTARSDRLASCSSALQRRQVLDEQVGPALHVPRPERTTGKRILVYDDVFTTGGTLERVARKLIVDGGAAKVCGVTLARQPWKGP